MQLRKVHSLLKKYEAKAIIAAINNSNVFSLHAMWLEDLIRQEQQKLDVSRLIERKETIVVENQMYEMNRESFGQKTISEKLLELE